MSHRCEFYPDRENRCTNRATHCEAMSSKLGKEGKILHIWLCDYCLPKAHRLWKNWPKSKIDPNDITRWPDGTPVHSTQLWHYAAGPELSS